jgi:hypothetical protein
MRVVTNLTDHPRIVRLPGLIQSIQHTANFMVRLRRERRTYSSFRKKMPEGTRRPVGQALFIRRRLLCDPGPAWVLSHWIGHFPNG